MSENQLLDPHWVTWAAEEIRDVYGDRVLLPWGGMPLSDLGLGYSRKRLLKFGRTTNADSGVKTTVMTLAGAERLETYVTSNAITHIASGNAGDATTFNLEGHTIDASNNLTFTVQSGTLAGQTKTALTTPLARATRLYNTGTTSWTGPVYVAEDVTFSSGVPQTDSAVHLIVASGQDQSAKCATAISSTQYWIVTQAYASLEKGNASTVTADVEIENRTVGATLPVFRPAGLELTLRAGGSQQALVNFEPYIIIPKNNDVRMVATSNTNDTSVSGHINGVLLRVLQ